MNETSRGNRYLACGPMGEGDRAHLESLIDAAVDEIERRNSQCADPEFPYWCSEAWRTSNETDPRCAGGCGSAGHWLMYGPAEVAR